MSCFSPAATEPVPGSPKALCCASAAPNIALSKYWGKRDPELNLPAAPSCSVTLSIARTRVRVLESGADRVSWQLPGDASPRVSEGQASVPALRMLSYARRSLSLPPGLDVVFLPSMRPGIGLAGSAAAMAALACALEGLAGSDTDAPEVRTRMSILARVGSGSACRSVFGGFVLWQQGQRSDGLDSFSMPLHGPGFWPGLGLAVVLLATASKEVSSTEGMRRCAKTSPLYEAWLEACRRDCAAAASAIAGRDLEALGAVAEANALLMHAVCRAARPPLIYANEQTRMALELVKRLRDGGLPVYATLDAGPNPVLIFPADREAELLRAFAEGFPRAEVLRASAGNGAQLEPCR